MMTFPTEWKVIKFHGFQSPPTSLSLSISIESIVIKTYLKQQHLGVFSSNQTCNNTDNLYLYLYPQIIWGVSISTDSNNNNTPLPRAQKQCAVFLNGQQEPGDLLMHGLAREGQQLLLHLQHLHQLLSHVDRRALRLC